MTGKTVNRYHKGNVAEDLVLVAKRILETETIEDLSVRRLAREVGVTPANFYNHFESLNALLLDIAAEAFEERAKLIAHISRTSRTRAEAVRRAASAFVEHACRYRQTFRIMFGAVPGGSSHQRVQEAADVAFGAFVELVCGDARYDPDDLPRSRERAKPAYAVFAMNYGIARMITEGQWPFDLSDTAMIRTFVEGVVQSVIDGELAKTLEA